MRSNVISIILFSLWISSCGNSIFEAAEPTKDPAEEATRALEEGDYETAISVLTSALESEPTNYQYVSLLASAKAQKAGVDTMDFALEMASGNTSDSGITGLFSVVSDATADNLTALGEAVDLMDTIPSSDQTAADQFKTSMFYTSLMTMRTKALDTDGDGVLSAEELANNLNDSNASDIINSIVGAEDALANYTADDGTGDAAGNVSAIKDAIDSQDGATDAEKLRNYLGS